MISIFQRIKDDSDSNIREDIQKLINQNKSLQRRIKTLEGAQSKLGTAYMLEIQPPSLRPLDKVTVSTTIRYKPIEGIVVDSRFNWNDEKWEYKIYFPKAVEMTFFIDPWYDEDDVKIRPSEPIKTKKS